jgi:hypothetical protein
VILNCVHKDVAENLALRQNQPDGLAEHGPHHDSKKQQERNQR